MTAATELIQFAKECGIDIAETSGILSQSVLSPGVTLEALRSLLHTLRIVNNQKLKRVTSEDDTTMAEGFFLDLSTHSAMKVLVFLDHCEWLCLVIAQLDLIQTGISATEYRAKQNQLRSELKTQSIETQLSLFNDLIHTETNSSASVGKWRALLVLLNGAKEGMSIGD